MSDTQKHISLLTSGVAPQPVKASHFVRTTEFHHPDFTNPDSRLRPRWPMPRIATHPRGYEVTKEAFPELYAEYFRMMKLAGLDAANPRLIVSNEIGSDTGMYLRSTGTVYVNQSIFNSWSFDELLNQPIAHELAHAWRQRHPTARTYPHLPMTAHFSPAKTVETEADLIGVCLQGHIAGLTQWLANHSHGSDPDYPSKSELRQALATLAWSDCPVGGLPQLLPRVATPAISSRNK